MHQNTRLLRFREKSLPLDQRMSANQIGPNNIKCSPIFLLICQVLLFNFTLGVADLDPLFSIFSFGEQGMRVLLDLLFAVEGYVSEAANAFFFWVMHNIIVFPGV